MFRTKMHFLISLIAFVVFLVSVLADVVVVVVGGGSSDGAFKPQSIRALPGDIMQFQFYTVRAPLQEREWMAS